jgi:hypothetical protein
MDGCNRGFQLSFLSSPTFGVGQRFAAESAFTVRGSTV